MSRLRGLQSKLSTLIFAGGWLVKQFCIIRLCLDDPVQKSLAPLYLLSGEVWDFSIRDSIFWYEKKRESNEGHLQKIMRIQAEATIVGLSGN
jgi:hypothetical protein